MARGAPDYSTMITQFLGESYSLGAGQDVDPSKLITLMSNGTSGQYDTLHTSQAADGTQGTDHYQVPTGKTFVAMFVIWSGPAAGDRVILGYGDDAVSASATAPTNAKALVPDECLTIEVARRRYSESLIFQVPAGKYPYAKNSNATNPYGVLVFGIER